MTKTQRTARILAPAVLIAVALVLSVAWAAPPTAPKFLELGKGPTIVLVHELGGNRMTWMPTAKKLIGQYHVVLVDLPGHGGNPLPDPFSLETSAEALDLVLARQNPDSTVIVGKGLGGMLALLALKAHPGRARGLVLIETGLKSPLQDRRPGDQVLPGGAGRELRRDAEDDLPAARPRLACRAWPSTPW